METKTGIKLDFKIGQKVKIAHCYGDSSSSLKCDGQIGQIKKIGTWIGPKSVQLVFTNFKPAHDKVYHLHEIEAVKEKVGRPKKAKELPNCSGCLQPQNPGTTHYTETRQHPTMIQALAADSVDSLKIKQTSATYNLSKGAYTFDIEISEKHLKILNSFKDLEFVFASKNAPETIKRWEEVTAMLAEAIKLLKAKRTLK